MQLDSYKVFFSGGVFMESIQRNKQLINKFNEIQEEILKIGWNGIIQNIILILIATMKIPRKLSKCTNVSMKT